MMHHVILIESQWNLNSGVVAMSFTNNLDINRITVEFKFLSFILQSRSSFHINRITVEFKSDSCDIHAVDSPNINRITVEFKYSTNY